MSYPTPRIDQSFDGHTEIVNLEIREDGTLWPIVPIKNAIHILLVPTETDDLGKMKYRRAVWIECKNEEALPELRALGAEISKLARGGLTTT